MAIDVGELKDRLLEMSTIDVPGKQFCHAIAELARAGRFEQLRSVLPEVVYNELEERYRADPALFIAGWRQLASKMRQGFLQHARQRLTNLTRLQKAGLSEKTPEWQEI